jgi:hypothetical protein
MTVLLSPIGNGVTFLNAIGQPLSGGKIYTYLAGSSAPLATYTDVNGTIANANPIILGADGKVPSEIWLTQNYSYKFVVQDSTGASVSSYDNIYGILQSAPSVTPSSVPTGCILIWSGAIGNIPSGFIICDGTNGTPDLRDRFVLGAGNNYAVSATGGSTDAIVVSHTHTLTDPGHSHNYDKAVSTAPQSGNSTPCFVGNTSTPTSTATTGITIASAGTSGANANMPPYYALCYIMKS